MRGGSTLLDRARWEREAEPLVAHPRQRRYGNEGGSVAGTPSSTAIHEGDIAGISSSTAIRERGVSVRWW